MFRSFVHFSDAHLIVIGRGSLIATAQALNTRARRPGQVDYWPPIDDEIALARGKAVVALGEADANS